MQNADRSSCVGINDARFIARTSDGIEILLTDEHHDFMAHKVPAVAINYDVSTADVKGYPVRIKADRGLIRLD